MRLEGSLHVLEVDAVDGAETRGQTVEVVTGQKLLVEIVVVRTVTDVVALLVVGSMHLLEAGGLVELESN